MSNLKKRIDKKLLNSSIVKCLKNDRITTDFFELEKILLKFVEKEEEKNNIKKWIFKNYLKKDFFKWWEKQKNIATSNKNIKRIILLKEQFNNLKINKINFLTDFLDQDPKNKEVNINFEKLQQIKL